MHAMTGFQRSCRLQLERALAPLGVIPQFHKLPEKLDGKADPEKPGHYRADLNTGERIIQVYLYHDEAGFKTDGNWYVFERQRYGDETALIRAMSNELAGRFPAGA